MGDSRAIEEFLREIDPLMQELVKVVRSDAERAERIVTAFPIMAEVQSIVHRHGYGVIFSINFDLRKTALAHYPLSKENRAELDRMFLEDARIAPASFKDPA